MTNTTQCPACQTRFKVSDAQLSAANGLVRCGRCAHVFNAKDHFVDQPPAARPAATPTPAPEPRIEVEAVRPLAARPVDDIDDFELEVPDFDPETAVLADSPLPEYPESPDDTDLASGASQEDVDAFQQALNQALQSHPVGNPFDRGDTPREATHVEPLAPSVADDVDQDPPAIFDTRRKAPVIPEEPETSAYEPLAPHEPEEPLFDPAYVPETQTGKRAKPLTITLLVIGSLIGVILLALQLVYLNRTLIASQAPELRPLMENVCRRIGCTVPLPTDLEFIRTEWSDLAFVPEHANLVQLSATLKNHAPYLQAFPVLEVTLKDANNLVLIRKVFTPHEYLKPEDQKLQSFAANSEIKIIMRFDVGSVHAQGYSLYWFYP